MESADELLAIIQAFFEALKQVFNALKGIFNKAEEATTVAAE